MKRLIVTTLMVLAFVTAGLSQQLAAAEGNLVSFDATLDLYSAYVWRGMALSDEPVLQPGGTVSLNFDEYGSVSAGVWANFDLTDVNRTRSTGGLNEIDYTLSYAIDIEDISLEIGHIWYTFPKAGGPDYGPSTREVYASAAYNNDIVVPSVAVYHDYTIDGTYASFALSKDIEIDEQVTAGVFASLGAAEDNFNRAYFASPKNSVVDGNIGGNVSYAINDNFSVGATLVLTTLLDSDLRANSYHSKETILWGGLNLAASF